MLELLLTAINPEKPLQNVIWSLTTQGDRGFFPLEPATASCEAKRQKISLADQALVVQTMNRAIHRINHYPVDECYRETDCVIHYIEI